MRRQLLLSAVLGTLAATGCLFKGHRTATAIARPTPPLPSPLAKSQPPKPDLPPPTPSPATTAVNTLPDESEYKAVPIPAPPQRVVAIVPTSNLSAEPDADDAEKKRLLERLRERRDERREERKDAPKLPSATAPKETPPKEVAGDGVAVAKRLYAPAYAKYEKMTDAEAVLTRREVVGGKETPTEEILFQFRKQPFSVYMKNIGENGKGREVLYVDGKFDGLMHVVTGQGDNRLIGAGFKTSLRPDSSMATSKSRHKITDAGPGNLLVRLDKHIKAAEAGQRTIKPLGVVTRKDQPNPVEGIEITLPPGEEGLPKGGKWFLYFDPKADSPTYAHLMVHVMTDEKDREVEYYCFTKWRVPANLTDADFHPDRLGKKK